MYMLFKNCMVWLLSLVLLGCSSQISKDFSFSPSKNVGVVIASLPESSFTRSVSVQEYNPDTLEIVPTFAVAGAFGTYAPFSSNAKVFMGISLEEGHYAITQVTTRAGSGLRTVLVGALPTFEVKTGEVLYIGDLDVNGYARMSHIGFSNEAAAKFLEAYPNLPQKFETVKPVSQRLTRVKKWYHFLP